MLIFVMLEFIVTPSIKLAINVIFEVPSSGNSKRGKSNRIRFEVLIAPRTKEMKFKANYSVGKLKYGK